MRKPSLLHIHSGDMAAGVHRRSGLPGAVIGWKDSAAVGPSPRGLSFEEYRAVRASFRRVDPHSFQDLDSLEAGQPYDEIVLWFDPCPYDQIILVRLLDWLRGNRRQGTRVTLAGSEAFEARRVLHGFGEAEPAQLEGSFVKRREVTTEQYEAAAAVWHRFCSPVPEDHARLVATSFPSLPFVDAALLRLMAEYPSLSNGLGLTEQFLLTAVGRGSDAFPAIFKAVDSMEPPQYGCWYGDQTLFSMLRSLAEGPAPLVQMGTSSGVRLTRLGEDALDGGADTLAVRGVDRWVGGVHIHGASWPWRWDSGSLRLSRK